MFSSTGKASDQPHPSVHPITRNLIPERRNGCRSSIKSSLPFARINRNLSPFSVSALPIPDPEGMHNVDSRWISPAGY